jgi:hypothetical protein
MDLEDIERQIRGLAVLMKDVADDLATWMCNNEH